MPLLPYLEANRTEAGCDEVGRGCLAGPVVAAAVILPEDFKDPGINDSKKLKKEQREELIKEIKSQSIAWAIAEASVQEIDQLNILNASFLAMKRAIEQLTRTPQHLLIDGNRWKSDLPIPHTCVIKGDGLYCSIAAASILAKVYRDQQMEKLALTYPQYGWEKNVGYPTKLHREGIRKFGASPWHRSSFRLLPEQLSLPFDSNE